MQIIAVTAPKTMIITPRRRYARDFLLNARKNFGPAISPTAVTKSAVPILETRANFDFIESPHKVICVSTIENVGK